jgi:hypothetical protein
VLIPDDAAILILNDGQQHQGRDQLVLVHLIPEEIRMPSFRGIHAHGCFPVAVFFIRFLETLGALADVAARTVLLPRGTDNLLLPLAPPRRQADRGQRDGNGAA